MTKHHLHIFLFFAVALLLLTSCDKNIGEIQRASKVAFIPTSEAENFVMKYTDSARIKSILKSPLMYDYSQLEFPFTEFPEGVDIVMYDDSGKKSFIVADYAINFSKSEIIELKNNVKITSQSGDQLETSQLYYDRKREWIFTEEECKLTNQNGAGYVKGFDSSVDLTKVEGREFKGSGTFSEE